MLGSLGSVRSIAGCWRGLSRYLSVESVPGRSGLSGALAVLGAGRARYAGAPAPACVLGWVGGGAPARAGLACRARYRAAPEPGPSLGRARRREPGPSLGRAWVGLGGPGRRPGPEPGRSSGPGARRPGRAWASLGGAVPGSGLASSRGSDPGRAGCRAGLRSGPGPRSRPYRAQRGLGRRVPGFLTIANTDPSDRPPCRAALHRVQPGFTPKRTRRSFCPLEGPGGGPGVLFRGELS